jgi:hypothetical protein
MDAPLVGAAQAAIRHLQAAPTSEVGDGERGNLARARRRPALPFVHARSASGDNEVVAVTKETAVSPNADASSSAAVHGRTTLSIAVYKTHGD